MRLDSRVARWQTRRMSRRWESGSADVVPVTRRTADVWRPRRGPIHLSWICLALVSVAHCKDVGNYSYAGPCKREENRLTAEDYKRDLDAAFEFKRRYPTGFLTVFGGSKLRSDSPSYRKIYEFAREWSDRYGNRIPILSGAGPGAMEAASRGAYDSMAKVSIGYTTYYGTDKPDEAFWRYEGRPIITDGLIFTSVSIRETMMITHSAAMVFTPGGSGTEWEIFQALEMIKSDQLTRIPIYFLGSVEEWESFWRRIDSLAIRGMLGRNGDGTLRRLDDYFLFVDDMRKEIPTLAKRLGLSD